LRGLGFALFFGTVTTAALHGVRQADMARASALFTSFRQVAASVGIAIAATYLSQRAASLAADEARGLDPGTPAFDAAIRHGQLLAFHEAFVLAGAIMVPALVISLLLRAGQAVDVEQPAVAITEAAPAD